MEGVAAFGGAMRTRLLVSVDRSKSVEEARENVELAIDLKKVSVSMIYFTFQGECGAGH